MEKFKPMLIDLPPDDAALAYERRLVDGVALWEPFIASLRRDSRRVYSGVDLDVPLWNVLATTALDDRTELAAISGIETAHRSGVHRLQTRALDADDLDYLGAVLGLSMDRHQLRDLIFESHEWQTVEADDVESALSRAIESVEEFADRLGMPRTESSRSLRIGPKREGAIRLGYSPSIMCAPLHLSVLDGSLADAGVDVQFGPDITVERTARLSVTDRQEVIRLMRDAPNSPASVILVCGQKVEQRLREVAKSVNLRTEPKSAQGVLQELYELDLVPRSVFTGASFILTARIAVQHESQENAAELDARYALAQISRFMQWSSDLLAASVSLCTRCQAPLEQDLTFCPSCGLEQSMNCQKCGSEWLAKARFCGTCGASRNN
jgi:predicted RNA-binding Zn-ribbon protein involved in translation (DUF1610 family)